MCLTFFGLDVYPDLLFLLAFNRDEYINRPTLPTHFWPDNSTVLAGRDLEGSGTWLGITTDGRVALLTNLRQKDPVEPSSLQPHQTHSSRGDLTVNFLAGALPPHEYLQQIQPAAYNGFNLVVGDIRTKDFWYTNNDGCQGTATQLQPGTMYGLSNGVLMEWPKVMNGLTEMQEIMASANTTDHQLPWEKIRHQVLGDRQRLEHLAPHGRPLDFALDLDYLASSRFIDVLDTPYGPYGTRSQSILAVWSDGTAEMQEHYLSDKEQHTWQTETHKFTVLL